MRLIDKSVLKRHISLKWKIPSTFVNFAVKSAKFANFRNFWNKKILNKSLKLTRLNQFHNYDKTFLYLLSVKHYHRLKNFPGTWHLRSLISIKMTNQDTLLFSNQSINWLVHLSVNVFIIMFFFKTTNITISQERSTLKYDVFHSLPVFFLGSSIWAAVDWYRSMFFLKETVDSLFMWMMHKFTQKIVSAWWTDLFYLSILHQLLPENNSRWGSLKDQQNNGNLMW